MGISIRTGIGYDIHALKKGRKLILGGVEIPFGKGLAGHSDGDVLFHAIVDALLGAAKAGDIGDHFPSSDAKYRQANSRIFMDKARSLLKKKNLMVSHIDAVIIAEAPKLAPYKEKIAGSIAKALGIKSSQVSVKAKMNEGLDAIGKGQAMACYAVATVKGRL